MTSLTTATRAFALDQSGRFGSWLAEAGEEPMKAVNDINAQMYAAAGDISLESVWQFTAEREDIREEWAKIWRENGLDVLLCPGARGTAVPHGNYGMPVYSLPWNLLDVSQIVLHPLQKRRLLTILCDTVPCKHYPISQG
jgi:amidase